VPVFPYRRQKVSFSIAPLVCCCWRLAAVGSMFPLIYKMTLCLLDRNSLSWSSRSSWLLADRPPGLSGQQLRSSWICPAFHQQSLKRKKERESIDLWIGHPPSGVLVCWLLLPQLPRLIITSITLDKSQLIKHRLGLQQQQQGRLLLRAAR
jgi:hypothetical protein